MSQTIRDFLISHLQIVRERKHQAYKRLVPTVTEVTEAAFALGAILGQIEVGYAVCGGTACAFLGGGRSTHDVDLVVEVDALKVPDIKRQVAEKDPTRFVAIGKSLYFVHENSVRIPIEMLPIENFTWPKPLGKGSLPVPSFGGEINVLSPTAIIFSKCGRAATNMHRDRPATMVKFGTDVQDMEFLCGQIADEEDLTTTIDLYTLKRRQSGFLMLHLRECVWSP